MEKSRRRFSPEQKASILREHLIEKVSVADLCDRHGLQPTVFYRWQKEMMENLVALFGRSGRESKAKKSEEQIADRYQQPATDNQQLALRRFFR